MIEISWSLLLTQVITFLIAMVLVWKFAWKPLTKMMNDRTRQISQDIEKAENGRREIESLEAEYKRRLAEIETRARQEIQQALQQGQQAKEEILKEARQEAQKIIDRSQEDLAAAREQVLRGLRAQVSEISLAAVERLLGQSMDSQVQKRLLDEFLTDLDKVEHWS